MKSLFLPFFLLMTLKLMAQTPNNVFYDHYAAYRQEGLEKRRIRQQDILPLLKDLEQYSGFSVTKAAESVEGRDIYLVKVGEGQTRVLLWSQMHGDEPTASLALMDIFNFFKQEGDPLEPLRQQLLKELTIYFIPMLNPDGAEVYQRRNAQGIDLNRDARRLASPEARLLKSVRDRLEADWGFNLHDQDIRYTAGKSAKPATISFLAPPYDEQRSVNSVRSRAMKLIAGLNNSLQAYIPGQVGKWSDAFEPRAFGDNIQGWGSSTILIESGGYAGDPEKQYIRKLNFVAIMEGLHAIASGAYAAQDLQAYMAIPENEKNLFDLIIRNVSIEQHGKTQTIDIGINRKEVELLEEQDFYYKSVVEELGDLSVFSGYQELEAEGLQLVPGRLYPEVFPDMEALQKVDIDALILSGYTAVQLTKLPAAGYTRMPLNILPAGSEKAFKLKLDAVPNFVLEKEGRVLYAIINGFVYDVHQKKSGIKNALVEKK